MTKKRVLYYNCLECSEYWASFSKYWEDLGDEIEYIKLYCPSCRKHMEKK